MKLTFKPLINAKHFQYQIFAREDDKFNIYDNFDILCNDLDNFNKCELSIKEKKTSTFIIFKKMVNIYDFSWVLENEINNYIALKRSENINEVLNGK